MATKQTMTAAEEYALIAQAQAGDRDAMDRLVRHHIGLVRKVSSRTRSKRLAWADTDDLIQEGCLALMRAVQTFNLEKGFQFSTYAWRCVSNAISTYIRDGEWREGTIPVETSDVSEVIDVGCAEPGEERNSQEDVAAYLDRLSEEQRSIVTLRYGLEGNEAASAQTIATMRGTSRHMVEVCLREALGLMRKSALQQAA